MLCLHEYGRTHPDLEARAFDTLQATGKISLQWYLLQATGIKAALVVKRIEPPVVLYQQRARM